MDTRLHYGTSKDLKENLLPSNSVVVSADEVRTLRGKAEESKKGLDKNSAIISNADLMAIRASASIKTKDDL